VAVHRREHQRADHAELTAGADYTKRITPDGLKVDPSTADVDTSSLASTFDTKTAGRVGFDTELTFKRGDTVGDDAPYTTLKYGVSGFLVIRRGVAYTTAWTTSQKVEVYPITCGEPQNSSPAANEVMKFVSPMKVTDSPRPPRRSPDGPQHRGHPGAGQAPGTHRHGVHPRRPCG
jgi:hypothetical protein